MRGGAGTGRGLMIGWARTVGADVAELFSGKGYAPAPLTQAEAAYVPHLADDWPRPVRYDYPDWLAADLEASLGDDLPTTMTAMQSRADVHLRVNTLKATRDTALAALAADDIGAAPHPLAETALQVTENARRVRSSRAFAGGLVELQDAASQAVVGLLGAGSGRALDFCAGGGGKPRGLAANGWAVTAHDAAPDRMKDIPARAARAGADIKVTLGRDLETTAPFDLVLVDAPCSGSGAWRRQPEARWALTPDRLAKLNRLQDEILDRATTHVAAEGRLAYATCSLLERENQNRLGAFLDRHNDWYAVCERTCSPLDGGDGFYIAMLERHRM